MLRPQLLAAWIVLGSLLFMDSCSEDFLEITPNGALDNVVLATYDAVDSFKPPRIL